MKRILIADDSPSWLKHHESTIKQIYGGKCSVDTANSAYEANDMLYMNADEPYDIILTDMQMESDFLPLYAGEWLIEQIQKMPEYKNSQIIIVSATTSIRLSSEKYHVDYLPKYSCRNIENYIEILNCQNEN